MTKIDKINQRNEIRREAKLPPISVAAEFRKIKTLEQQREWEEFRDKYIYKLTDKLVERWKQQNPKANFNWIVGMGLGSRASKIIRRYKRRYKL